MVEYIIVKGCITYTSLVTASNRKARDSSSQTLASATFLAYFAKSQAMLSHKLYNTSTPMNTTDLPLLKCSE